MAKITAADVKKLRDLTGAGMMDCKKALAATDGDLDAAVTELRKTGQKVSAKRADRDATEGAVIAKISPNKRRGVIVRLSCETDFVAKNADFVKMAQDFAQIALDKNPASHADLLSQPYAGVTIGEKVIEQNGVIGEKIELSAYETLEAPIVAPYIHMGNRAAVLVGLSEDNEAFFDAGRDVAMQIAAMHPIAVDKDGVDSTTVEKEIEIGMEQARSEGKPEAMLEKIARGKLNKFYKERTLLNQQFVKDGKKSVADYLHTLDKDLTVTDFKHVKLG